MVSLLLFQIYINDLINCSYLARCVPYADDTNPYLSSSSVSNLFATANEPLTEYKG